MLKTRDFFEGGLCSVVMTNLTGTQEKTVVTFVHTLVQILSLTNIY